jgi:DNA-binding NarL/FixJ family response regulator
MNSDYKTLIIDDSAQYRMIISKFLKNLGFENIETAEDGRLGVDKARSLKPHLVYLDGVMPTMDGITALQEIKKENPGTIVIISSSLSEKAKVLRFKEAGADFYLLKPYDREKFEEVTNKALAILENQTRNVS